MNEYRVQGHAFSPRHLLWTLATGLVFSLVVGACGDDGSSQPQQQPEFDFTLEVETKSLDGTPVSGVPVRFDGNVVGFTDANGAFAATLREQPGQEIELTVDEIDGYVVTGDELPKVKQLQVTRSLDGDYRGIPVRLSVDLRSTRLEYLTWVELSCDNRLDDEHCADVPILLDGQEQARTNHNGFVHFLFEGTPGEEHEFTVDIPQSGDVNVEPQRPRYHVELERHATIFHIAEEFTDPDARRAPRRRSRPRPQPRPQPQPQPEPEEEEDEGGVIPLF